MQRHLKKPTKQMLSPLRRNSMREAQLPHRGALCRVEDESNIPSYVIEIRISPDDDNDILDISTRTHELYFSRHDYEFTSRLFAILDTESINVVHRSAIQDFVHKRCPVFLKRDEDLTRLGLHTRTEQALNSPTFDEVWKAVVACSRCTSDSHDEPTCLGVEGWMVFCRFIALAQYLEAKRRFSARHLQQTMRHRNSPRGSEMVVVDFPPSEPPARITPEQLALYEQRSDKGLPLPELDLDHSLLAAHDSTVQKRTIFREQRDQGYGGVKILLFGSSKSASLLPQSTSTLEFAVSYSRSSSLSRSATSNDEVVVRRSMMDMKWLSDTFTSHSVLGGTLCGRILPPFPASSFSSGGVLSSHFPGEDSSFNATSIKNTTGGAICAAAAGVGRIRDVAKSFMSPIGSYLTIGPSDMRSESSASALSHTHSSHKAAKKKRNLNLALPENYYNPNSPVGKTRQLERYLNYLLEHPALSTSFPLNAILTASQSGLDAARLSLAECNRASKELRDQTPHVDDGKLGMSLSSHSPNFAWVRTAAQAAMALKVHGMLETTGMQAASARLQHASLPAFGPSARSSGWDEVDPLSADSRESPTTVSIPNAREIHNFEDGVVTDDGFDLLPLPVPAPERRILTVVRTSSTTATEMPGEERFYYGTGTLVGRYPLDDKEDGAAVFLGDIAVDENIDKLREVIGSVDNTLCRCLASSGGTGKAHKERLNLHLNVVRGLDSWEGMRGKFICQRSLLKGVAGVEQSKEIYEESDLALIDDLSWQTSLASSAVTAAEDVRAAVRVARTAANARAAASSAAFTAQTACEKGEFANLDEARAAQTRASIAQSHAIHAAVVEYEAKTVKRRATLALAHDVKTWNIHRKREMLQSCIAFARSQHEATRRSVDAWSTLRDGFIGTPVNPSTVERKAPNYPVFYAPPPDLKPLVEPGEATATIYENLSMSLNLDGPPSIVAVDHNVLATRGADPHYAESLETFECTSEPSKSAEFNELESILPFAEAAPIPEEEVDDFFSFHYKDNAGSSSSHEPAHESCLTDEKLSASMQSLVDGLMNWGGGFDAEEDHFALPIGMAASIVLEENHECGKYSLA